MRRYYGVATTLDFGDTDEPSVVDGLQCVTSVIIAQDEIGGCANFT
jgi:hypothetical protein